MQPTMQHIVDLAEAVACGLRPVVTFRAAGAADLESYPEENIRARIIGTATQGPELARLTFDFSEFDEQNRRFESANYYDENQVPCKTARDAGKYKPQASYTFGAGEMLEHYFQIEAGATAQLMAEHQATAPGTPYVAWLEQELLALRAKTCA